MTGDVDPDAGVGDSTASRIVRIAAAMALVWVVTARMLGPSDLWDQTQPRTVSYTTDIIVHGGVHWLLPVERGVRAATKPPLYNWLAVPAVLALGFGSEVAHRFPSLLAFMACWFAIHRYGARLDVGRARLVGPLASLLFASNYMIFKLGYLARPDMLLCLWILLAWMAATEVLAGDGPPRRRDVAVFWIGVALAGLTKGPPAVLPILYAVVAAPALGGTMGAIHRLAWRWGMPLALAAVGAWIGGVAFVDPDHLRVELWHNEIYGRVTGTGPEGGGGGLVDVLTELPIPALYLLSRFAPWSLAMVAAMVVVWHRRPPASWRAPTTRARRRLLGAAIVVVVVVCAFSLSSGKRADYVAPVVGPASLLAAWWIGEAGRRRIVATLTATVIVAGIVLALLTWRARRESDAPVPGYGRGISSFTETVADARARGPAAIAFRAAGESPMEALLGVSEPSGREQIDRHLDAGEPFWLVAGGRWAQPETTARWFRHRREGTTVAVEAVSETLPKGEGWPGVVVLYLVHPAPNSSRDGVGSDNPE